MVDDDFVGRVTQELQVAGLQPQSLDDPENGGFGVQPDGELLFVAWSPAAALSTVAFDRLTAGDIMHPSVLHMGAVKHAMADAILAILRSAGFDAHMSTDDMAPATVEVRPGSDPARA